MVAVIAAFSFLAIVLFDSMVVKIEEDQYTSKSIDLAETVALSVDADRVVNVKTAVSAIYDRVDEKVTSDEWDTPEYEDYLAKFSSVEDMEDYKLLIDELKAIQDVNDVRGLHVVYLDVPTESMVYLADASPEDVRLPGNADLLSGEDLAIIDNPDNGFDPSVTNTEEYGWNIGSAKPIYLDGELVAYACVDISMNELVAQRHRIIATIMGALLILAAIISATASLFANRAIVKPVNELSKASLKYRSGKDDEAFHAFANLDIHTGDEIEILAESMKDMEADIRSYSQKLSRVALTDSLTSANNRWAYDAAIESVEREIADGNTKVGLIIFDLNDLKTINDTYGHERGDIALQKLCETICQVFGRSPVYRIGGDEFAVILEGRNYQNAEELLRQFNEILESNKGDASLQPWERITAPAGFSRFDPENDGDMGSVFARVDEMMYERKRDSKAANGNRQA